MDFISRFFKAPEQSFILFGPRGTGKSTWIQRRFPEALRIDFLDPETLFRYSAQPGYLRQLVDGQPDKKIIVIDEVQKVPSILSVVHALIEEKRGLYFILTGSSARKLKSSGADLMAGRAIKCSLYPFMAGELKNEFSLERALLIGLLPLAIDAPDPERLLASYIGLYLREEIQAEGLVRNVGSFSRFLESISFSHASVLNIANVAHDCMVERKVVHNYVDILEDLLLSYRIPVFTKRAQRAVAAHPKFFLFDAGVFRALRPKGPLDRREEIDGAALEGLVLQHLKAWSTYSDDHHEIFYWRTRAGVEVDFVVYGPTGIWAIEVKNSSKISKHDTKSLNAFREDYPEAKTIMLYRGTDRLRMGDVLCMPCEEFLPTIIPNQPLF